MINKMAEYERQKKLLIAKLIKAKQDDPARYERAVRELAKRLGV